MQTESDMQVWQVPIKSNMSQKNAVCTPTGGEVVYTEERSHVPLWTTLPPHPVCSHWTSLPECLADFCAVSTVCVASTQDSQCICSFCLQRKIWHATELDLQGGFCFTPIKTLFTGIQTAAHQPSHHREAEGRGGGSRQKLGFLRRSRCWVVKPTKGRDPRACPL